MAYEKQIRIKSKIVTEMLTITRTVKLFLIMDYILTILDL